MKAVLEAFKMSLVIEYNYVSDYEDRKCPLGASIFFIPASLSDSFSEYLMQQEKQRKHDLLERVLIAQRQDPIGDVGIADGVD